MPKTLQEIIDHADDMSAAFDDYEPDPATLRDPAPMLRARSAVQARARAEADVATAVIDMRSSGYSWAAIGMVLGTSGEAARQRYGGQAPRLQPPRTSRRPAGTTRAAAKAAKAPRATARAAATSAATGVRNRAAATTNATSATRVRSWAVAAESALGATKPTTTRLSDY